MVPDDRPSFKDLYTNVSKYIEHIAGYLEIEFNPFAGTEMVKTTTEEREKEEGVLESGGDN